MSVLSVEYKGTCRLGHHEFSDHSYMSLSFLCGSLNSFKLML